MIFGKSTLHQQSSINPADTAPPDQSYKSLMNQGGQTDPQYTTKKSNRLTGPETCSVLNLTESSYNQCPGPPSNHSQPARLAQDNRETNHRTKTACPPGQQNPNQPGHRTSNLSADRLVILPVDFVADESRNIQLLVQIGIFRHSRPLLRWQLVFVMIAMIAIKPGRGIRHPSF